MGAAVSDYSRVEELSREILDQGGALSVASLRIDSLTSEEVSALRESGHRTVALAPEAGSQRLRDLINKGFDEEDVFRAVSLLSEGGILNLKLYFLIGLPTENADDIVEFLDLVARVREVWLAPQKKLGRLEGITLSVNPFIPKPFTPFQWAAMEEERSLSAKMRTVRASVARTPNVEVIFESVRSAALQAFLSRGDRRVGQTLPLLAAGRNLAAACRETGLNPAFYVTRERGEDRFPLGGSGQRGEQGLPLAGIPARAGGAVHSAMRGRLPPVRGLRMNLKKAFYSTKATKFQKEIQPL